MSDNKSTGGVRGSGYTSTAQQASQTIKQVLSDLGSGSFSPQAPFHIGRLENEIVTYAREQGIDIADGKNNNDRQTDYAHSATIKSRKRNRCK